MPERRKMKSPSPQMTSTPKMKRKDREHDSPMDDMKSRLGYKEKSPKKDIPLESMDVLDYNDGTTRPMFKKRLRNVTADVGELAQMECVVSGTPQPKVLWLKNNRPLKDTDGCKVIVDDNKNILVFPSAKDDDVGTYTARAMNVNGSVMSTAEFTITDGKPLPAQSITDSPMDLDFTTPAYFFQMSSCEVTEGRLARFDCRVVAYPKPEIVWMRDGKVMESSERFKLLNFNNEIYSLLIQDVTLADTGRYTCWARNKFGEAMTEAYLNVVALTEEKDEGDMAPKFLTRFYDQQTTEGTAVDFKCLIAGRPEPSVTWLLDDVELTDSPSSRMKYKDGMVSLEIKSPKVKQSGNYTCTIKNTVGEASCNAKLSVVEDHLHGKMLPKFLKKFDHSTAKDGEDVKFTCVVVGEPRPAVTWMFDHKPILDSNRHYVMKSDGDVYTLTIKGARFDDAGPITCKAVNSEGEVYCSANLHVRESMFLSETPEKSGYLADDIDSKYGYIPTFTKRLHDMEVKEGAKTIFDCRIMGIPDPDVTWMKDGRIVGPGSRYQVTRDGDKCRLVIDKATEKDVGVYTCIISNSKGKTSTTAGLKLEAEKPEKPKEDTRVKRYTPEKYGVDDVTSVKRPYKIEAKPARRRSFDSSFSSRFDDSSLTYPKRSYESPRRDFSFDLDSSYQPYDSSKNDYSFDLYSPRKPYERSRSDHSYEIDSPRKSYESPRTGYSFDYQSPRRPYESPKLDTSLDRSRPRRLYTRSRSNDLDLETPRKDYYTRVEPSGPTPVIPYDRPSLMNKREDSVRLSWLPAPTLNLPAEARHISYVVESREVPGKEWVKVASHVPTTTYTVKHLRPDKEYDFRVRAANHHGLSEPTYPASLEKRHDDLRKFTDLPEMRAAPRLPTHRPIITDLGAETVRLAWKPAEQYQAKRIPPVSYRLEAMELPGKDWLPLSSRLRDTSHYLSELPQDRDYMIRVRAENDFGISEPTEPLWLPRARVFPGVPISRPEIVEVEAGKARLSWTRVDIPTFGLDDAPLRYMLEVEEPSKDWRPVARDLDSTEYLIDGLKPDHDYKFRVRAKTLTGVISEPSPAASLYTTLARSRAPVDRLEVLEYEPDTRSVQLSWQRVEIPPYHLGDEPLLYMLEYQEPPLPDWKMLVTGIPTTRYRVMHLDPDREYSFRVRALTSYGVSPPSPALPVSLRNTPVVRPLPDPVIISEVEPDSLRLTWRRPMYDLSQPITYQIEMLEPPIHYWKPLATGYTDTTYKVTGLKPTKDYQFRVIPHIQSKSLEPTPIAALTSSPVRPRLPMSEPSLKELTPDSVLLSWRPAELPVFQRIKSPIHYRLEMQEVPSSKWTPVARRITDTSYKVTGLRPNVDYKFRVYGETEFGSSEPSLPTLLHRKPAPKFPTNEPTIRDITPNIVMLSWLPAEVPSTGDPLMYRIEIQTPPGIGSWTTLYAAHPLPSIRLADIRPDLDYLVRVRAVYGDYVSEPTQPVYIPRRACPPRMPVDEPYAVEITSDAVKLQWRNAELPTHITDYAPITYCLEAQELPHGTWMTVSRGIPHTDFKVTALNPQKDYAFRVRAENSYGLSDPTRSVVIKPRSVAPIMPHEQPFLYDVGDGTVRLSWRPATLPSHASSASPITYTIFVQEFPFKTWRPLVRRIPHTSYCIGGLKADADYNFRVQAENEHGSSQPTEPVYLPKLSDIKRPISMPEVSDFDDDFTSMKIHWKPIGPHFEKSPHKYLIETWEPLRREWKPFVRGIADTSYRLKDLPKVPEPIFRVRMETEQAGLSEPSLPVSIGSAYKHPRMPVYRPQLFELDTDTVRLSWQPVYEPEGVLRSRIRYLIEQREIPESRWITVASDLMETSYRVKGLRSKSDYEFRVRAVIDGTTSEPSFPVCLYRRSVIPRVRFETPEVTEIDDTSICLTWRKVDIPAFSAKEEPLLFMIERQELPNYEWVPVAVNVPDTSYKISGLKPYQDYNFRVRGIFPSGYTEASPYVPVYRRPSESFLGVFGVESRNLVSNISGSHKYTPKPTPSVSLPTQSLRASVPSDYSPLHRTAIHSRMTRATKAYEIPEIVPEAPFKPEIPQPRFRREEAYVYQRSLSPSPGPKPVIPLTIPETRPVELEERHDVYDLYKRTRRHSDAGLEYIQMMRDKRAAEAQELEFERSRIIYIVEDQHQARKAVKQETKKVSFQPPPPVSVSDEYVSVADRYEDIKTPFITSHWIFPRRHSLSYDYEDFLRLKSLTAAGLRPGSKKFKSRTDDDLLMTNANQSYYVISDAKSGSRVSRVDTVDPGYFSLSKFSLSVSESQRYRSRSPPPRMTGASFSRPSSLEPSRGRGRSVERTFDSLPRGRSVSQSRSVSEWEALSKSITEQLEKAKIKRDRARSEAKSVSRAGSVYSTRAEYKPRSQSISVPSSERTPFNRLVENSKSLISSYSRLDQSASHSRGVSMARGLDTSSVADVKADPRYSFTPRASLSTTSGASTRHVTPAPSDVRTDPRYSTRQRASISVVSTEREKRSSVADLRADSRYSDARRATFSSETNRDLKAKLDILNAQLSASKSKKKKSKTVMKYKSSRGEGYVME